MKITFFILLLFCALKTSAQGLGGEIKRSDNTPTDKAAMKQKIIYKHGKSVELDNSSVEDIYSIELEEKAQQGNAAAQYALAKIYCLGKGVEPNEELSNKYLVKSAEQGYTAALYTLGKRYLNGNMSGVPQYDLAHKYFVLAADKGHINAIFHVGLDYLLGRGVLQNVSKGLLYVEDAAKENDESALNFLGIMYRDGRYNQQQNPRKAFDYFLRNALQGNADAQSYLGQCYMYGFGTEKDGQKAFEWLKKSASNGSSDGYYWLAMCYEKGCGVKRDLQEFFSNMMISANLGDASAKAQIGSCYIRGEGVEKDEKEAVRWFIIAANQGDALGQFYLGNCFLDGIGIEKDHQTAIVWLKKAADAGFSPAMDTLNQLKK